MQKELSSNREKTNQTDIMRAPIEEQTIDQEIELLELMRKGHSTKSDQTKLTKIQSNYLQNFEEQFNNLEDEEIINRYIKNEDPVSYGLERTKTNPKIAVLDPIDKNLLGNNKNKTPGNVPKSENEDTQRSDQVGITKQQFDDYIEAQANRAKQSKL